MTIPTSATVTTLLAPNLRTSFVDERGVLTTHGWQVLTNFLNYFQGATRILPCNVTGTNTLALSMLTVAPQITQYFEFDTYRFIAANTSTGLVSATVTTSQNVTLATLKVYKSNGAAQATTGDIVAGSQYDLTYVDSLNSGAGGFVLR